MVAYSVEFTVNKNRISYKMKKFNWNQKFILEETFAWMKTKKVFKLDGKQLNFYGEEGFRSEKPTSTLKEWISLCTLQKSFKRAWITLFKGVYNFY